MSHAAKGRQQQQQTDMMMIRSQGNNHNNNHNNVNGQPPSSAAAVKSQPSRHDAETRSRREGMSPADAQWTAQVSRGFSDPSLAVAQAASNKNNNSHNRSVVGCRQKSPELFHSHHYHARRQRDRLPVNCSRSSSAADLSLQSSTVNLSLSSPGSASSLNNVNHIKVSYYFMITIEFKFLFCDEFSREINQVVVPVST